MLAPIPMLPPVTIALLPSSIIMVRTSPLFSGKSRPALAAVLELTGQPLGSAFRAFAAIRSPQKLARTARCRALPEGEIVRFSFLGKRRHPLVGLQTRVVNR